MNWAQRLLGRLAVVLRGQQAVAAELHRWRAIFVQITGEPAAADLLINCAKACAHRLAAPVFYPASKLLPVILDEITRRLVVGLSPDYIAERVAGLQSVQELQAMAVLATLEPVGIDEPAEESA